jgi:hypothetical protein
MPNTRHNETAPPVRIAPHLKIAPRFKLRARSGGYNADGAFFDALERQWRLKHVCALDPYPGGFEKLYLLKRKHGWARRALAKLSFGAGS